MEARKRSKSDPQAFQMSLRIRAEGGQISLLVALAPSRVSSFNLPPEVSRIFGELGVTIEFELTDG